MTDNWCQVVKIGKKRTDTSSGAIIKRSYYYLTPYSLGVTYIPKDVLKETFIANLDTMCRLTKLGSSAIIYNNQTNGMENATTKEILNSATGCIADGDGNETSVYHNGVSNKHQTTSTENIINDGIIEYDLSTIQLKVEYFVVDFWDTNNAIVVNRCVGQVAKSYETNDDIKTKLQNNVKDYRDNDTGYNYLKSLSNTTTKYYLNGSEINLAQGYEANQGNTVVAKVSARVKVHIPYDNAFIQWAVEKYTYHRGGSEHYDIKLYNAANSAQDFRDGTYTDEDGVWYQTSIYYAVTN
jgi:hypothetical protein